MQHVRHACVNFGCDVIVRTPGLHWVHSNLCLICHVQGECMAVPCVTVALLSLIIATLKLDSLEGQS